MYCSVNQKGRRHLQPLSCFIIRLCSHTTYTLIHTQKRERKRSYTERDRQTDREIAIMYRKITNSRQVAEQEQELEEAHDHTVFGSQDDIPLRDMREAREARETEAQAHDPLLSSFEEADEAAQRKTSDERLHEHEGEGDEHARTLQEAMFTRSTDDNAAGATATTTTIANEPSQPPATSATSAAGRLYQAVNMRVVSNGFNILDRLFKTSTEAQGSSGVSVNNNSRGTNAGNDGVFSNMSAKPDAHPPADADKPPTYDEAAADATPPYWENSILSPGFEDEVFVDGLPVGNAVNFVWNLMVSASFQFVGFLLTYVLHTSHAAKQGSRTGLGVTFFMYAYTMFPSRSKLLGASYDQLASERITTGQSPTDYHVSGSTNVATGGSVDKFHSTLPEGTDMSLEETHSTRAVVVSALVALLGLYIVVRALVDYQRARRMEQVILAPPANLPEIV